MARFDVRVDTAELGAEIARSAGRIDGVSREVTSAGAALVAAEAEAAQAVCAQLSGGFLLLVRNQIQQRLARSLSTILARTVQLNQEERTARGIREQFLRDFQMIKNRYVRLFSALDRSLDQQIAQLDRPAMELIRTENGQNVKRRYLSSAIPVQLGSEGPQAAGQIIDAAAKGKISATLEKIRQYIDRLWVFRKQTQALLVSSSSTSTAELSLPVLLMEADDNSSDATTKTRRYPGRTHEDTRSGAVLRSFFPDLEERLDGLAADVWKWGEEDDAHRQAIMARLTSLTDGLPSGGEREKRVREMILPLARASDWQKNGRVQT